MEVLNGKEMRAVDTYAIDTLGIPGLLLMETAGRGIARAALRDVPELAHAPVFALCGSGNNGGDGLVIARALLERGIRSTAIVLTSPDRLKQDPAANLRAARALGIEIVYAPDTDTWKTVAPRIDRRAIVFDAMLGTGIEGGARGRVAEAIAHLSETGCRVLAVDLPSGLDADRPRTDGVVARAERTYTLCRPKLPLAVGDSDDLTGPWTVVPIGVPDAAVLEAGSRVTWLDRDGVVGTLPPRRATDHKGTYGHLLAVAGSGGKTGAAVLLARAALRTGVGLMTVATPASVRTEVAVQQAEVMTADLPESSPGVLGNAATALLRLAGSFDAVAFGPGLGTATETRRALLTALAGIDRPCVIDADALNAAAAEGETGLAKLRDGAGRRVLTPHPGEAARLLSSSPSDVQSDRLSAARELASTTASVVVLKGHRTVIARPDGDVAINGTGNPGMGSGGTGDVLTGMIGALLARGLDPWDAARLGVWAHGTAGDRAASVRGQDGVIASDVVDEISATLAPR